MKMKLTATALAVITVLSALTFSVSAYITIESGDHTILWNPDSPPYISIDKEKVYQKAYTQEELEAYVDNQLAAEMRIIGELYVKCRTDDAEIVFYRLSSDEKTASYSVKTDEAVMRRTMLTLLGEGVYVSVMGVDFPPESRLFLFGDIDLNSNDYMMVKRHVLGTYKITRGKVIDLSSYWG